MFRSASGAMEGLEVVFATETPNVAAPAASASRAKHSADQGVIDVSMGGETD